MAFVNGFLLSLSLILVIGAQNALVLRVGLEGRHVFPLCLFCALSDALLILAGVAGVGGLLNTMQGVVDWMYFGAAVMLACYGALRLRSAAKGNASLEAGRGKERRLGPLLAIAAGMTWLNPHVYLDTVVLIGGIAATLEPDARVLFGTGACLASFVFFFGLGYSARALGSRLADPRIWRWIDLGIATVMFWIAAGLVLAALR